jgi:hypothetical protein
MMMQAHSLGGGREHRIGDAVSLEAGMAAAEDAVLTPEGNA